MSNLVETFATIVLMLFGIVLLAHLLNGTGIEWMRSMFVAAEAK
jgi:hypothetical protein